MLPVSGDLPPTATYKRRSWVWVGSSDPTALGDGTLTINLRKGVRPGSKVETDSYAVGEQPCIGYAGRQFLLVNLTDDSQPDAYMVRLGGVNHWSCTCDAGCVGRYECKHVAALRAVLTEGLLPDPRHNDEQDVAPTEAPDQSEVCGFCLGRGSVPGPTHDRYGYELQPRRLACEYCGGSGACAGGARLLPHRRLAGSTH